MSLAVPLDDPADVLAALCGVNDGEVLAVIHLVLLVRVTVCLTKLGHLV